MLKLSLIVLSAFVAGWFAHMLYQFIDLYRQQWWPSGDEVLIPAPETQPGLPAEAQEPVGAER